MLICVVKQKLFITKKITIMKSTTLIARILFALTFLMAGFSLFSGAAIRDASFQGVPFANFSVPLSGIMSITGSLSIILGYKTKIGAFLIILFLIPVTIAMHAFWNISDPSARQNETVSFMNNLSMLGGALLFFVSGAGAYSLDSKKLRKLQTT
jgi:putative oxidoreductase